MPTPEELQAQRAEETAAGVEKMNADAAALAEEQGHVIALVDGLLAYQGSLAWKPDGDTTYRLDTPAGSVSVIKDLDHKQRVQYSVNVQEPGAASLHTLRGSEDGEATIPVTSQLRALFERARGSQAQLGQVTSGILGHL